MQRFLIIYLIRIFHKIKNLTARSGENPGGPFFMTDLEKILEQKNKILSL